MASSNFRNYSVAKISYNEVSKLYSVSTFGTCFLALFLFFFWATFAWKKKKVPDHRLILLSLTKPLVDQKFMLLQTFVLFWHPTKLVKSALTRNFLDIFFFGQEPVSQERSCSRLFSLRFLYFFCNAKKRYRKGPNQKLKKVANPLSNGWENLNCGLGSLYTIGAEWYTTYIPNWRKVVG